MLELPTLGLIAARHTELPFIVPANTGLDAHARAHVAQDATGRLLCIRAKHCNFLSNFRLFNRGLPERLSAIVGLSKLNVTGLVKQ